MPNNIYFYKISLDDKDGDFGYITNTDIPNFAGDATGRLEKLAKSVLDKLNETEHMEPISVEIKFLDVFKK